MDLNQKQETFYGEWAGTTDVQYVLWHNVNNFWIFVTF